MKTNLTTLNLVSRRVIQHLTVHLCLKILLIIIDVMGNGSHVFPCFIDFSKAFDSVNYWLLFYTNCLTAVHLLLVPCLSVY